MNSIQIPRDSESRTHIEGVPIEHVSVIKPEQVMRSMPEKGEPQQAAEHKRTRRYAKCGLRRHFQDHLTLLSPTFSGAPFAGRQKPSKISFSKLPSSSGNP
jgi:hypothetical protein